MKKSLIVLVTVLFAASFAGAQSLTPTAHELGIGASFSTSTSTVRLFYGLNKSFVIEPLIGISVSNTAVSVGGGAATNFPGTWLSAGLGVYYVALRMPRLAVLIGPSGQFTYQKFTATGTNFPSGDQVTESYWNGELNLQVIGMITRNVGLFATAGGFYESDTYNDTTAGRKSVYTHYGLQTVSVGASYYFK